MTSPAPSFNPSKLDSLRVERVWKYHGHFPALRGVSIAAARGTCLALLGRNGAGKTTLLRILAGLSSPSDGIVHVFGENPRSPASRGRIGYLGHGIGIYDEFTARENLTHFARLHGLSDRPASVGRWLERVDLARVADAPAREFSRGMRQRLALARVFLHGPSLLILDEPFTSLDDRAIQLLQSLLQEAISAGASVVLSTHQLREALQLATHIAVLERGNLVSHQERTATLLQDPALVYGSESIE